MFSKNLNIRISSKKKRKKNLKKEMRKIRTKKKMAKRPQNPEFGIFGKKAFSECCLLTSP